MPSSSTRISLFDVDHDGTRIPNGPIPAERRSRVRYPLELSVQFRSISGSASFGAARAVNVSSGGILVVFPRIVSQQEIRVGVHVELNIEWPFLLDGRIPLQLFAVGRVIRCSPWDFAASFERHQFRTMKSSIQPSVGPRRDVIKWPPTL
jgi:hypothetical protein